MKTIQILKLPEGITSNDISKWWEELEESEETVLRPKINKELEPIDIYTGMEYMIIGYFIYHNLPIDRTIETTQLFS